MSVQTTVTLEPAFGAAGMEYDIGFNDVVSKIATVAIPFGSYVVFVGETCKLPTTTGEVSAGSGGFALIGPAKAANPAVDGYAIGDIVPVLTKGRCWIVSETALAQDLLPFARHAGGVLGGLRNTADTANATVVPGAKMFSAASGVGTLAVVSINQP